MALGKIKQAIVRLGIKLDILIKEKTNSEGVKYIFENKGSDELVIVFSGIGPHAYNYRRSFKNSSRDQLFIKDCWADGVSYYLYENGETHPEELTTRLIEGFLKGKKYNKVYTAGSSKGGYAALYYGLKFDADEIYVGACQYNLGNYLGYHEHQEYYPKVMGVQVTDSGIALLDSRQPLMIESRKGSKSQVHLLYSTEEHTYQDHIVDLLSKLDSCNICHQDYVEKFPKHSMVGEPFKKLLAKSL